MVLVGAGGFAKEILEILHQNDQLYGLAFYDDVNLDRTDLLYGKFPILKSPSEVVEHFEKFGPEFNIAIGKPQLRKIFYDKFSKIGGELQTVKSKHAEFGSYDVNIGTGSNILSGVKISNSVNVGVGCIIYYNSIITHDVNIGDFSEISPGVTLLGNVKIGELTSIGGGSIILPNIKVGKNVVIGAGTVVNKDLPDNCVAVGVPSKIIKYE